MPSGVSTDDGLATPSGRARRRTRGGLLGGTQSTHVVRATEHLLERRRHRCAVPTAAPICAPADTFHIAGTRSHWLSSTQIGTQNCLRPDVEIRRPAPTHC
jgi:hypothetical protein